MMNPISGMKYIPDRDGYIQFINYIDKYCFQDIVQTEKYFGLELSYDEDTGYYTESILEYKGDIGLCPESFPAIVYYRFEDLEDRVGKVHIRWVHWATTENLGIKVAEYNEPVVKLCKRKGPILVQYEWNKCKRCDGYCKECEDYWVDGTYLGYTEEQWAAYCEFDRKRTRELLSSKNKE
jgi:hypothetical protein